MTTSTEQTHRSVHVERVMGTVVSFDLRGAGEHELAVSAAVERLHAIDARFSTYRPGSEVSRYARGELHEEALSDELRHVLARCRAFHQRSGGAFDAMLPSGFDPSAYVKGWAVDECAALLDAHGCSDWSINAGGDVRTRRHRRQAPWRVGIRHPEDPTAVAAVVPAWDLAVATSGRYERGDHLIDPRISLLAEGAASVTVCGSELAEADAIATAAFVLGADGPAWVAGIPGYECWSVLPDARVVATAGFPRFVAGIPVSTAPAAPTLQVTA